MQAQPLTQIVVYYTGTLDTVQVAFHRKRRKWREIRNRPCGVASASRIERIMRKPPLGWAFEPPIIGTQCVGLAIKAIEEPE